MTTAHPDDMPQRMWAHPDPESTPVAEFRNMVNRKRGKNLRTFADLHKYSITELSNFYHDVWEATGIIYEGDNTYVVDENAPMDSNPDWFPDVRMNWTENVLFTPGRMGTNSRTTMGKEDDKVALISVREGGSEEHIVTWGQLRQRVGLIANALRANGVKKGDRVAGVVSNAAEPMMWFLATVSIGALYSSSATDMGTKGILDRMIQIEPTYVIMDDASVYNRKKTDLRPKMTQIVEGMKGIENFRGVISLPRFVGQPVDVSGVPKAIPAADFLAKATSDKLVFEQVAFRHPYFIAYSSGTTGKPKCIVHCGGGAILCARREQLLHFTVNTSSTFLQFTTTGWIMYLAQLNALHAGARVVLYDGSPFMPTPEDYINVLGKHRVTHLGTSPRYFHELQQRKISPREVADLSALKMVTSTGMVLATSLFHWFYDVGFPKHAVLNNITGGTDTNAALAAGNLLDPLYDAGCHGLSTGHAIEVYKLVPDTHGVPVLGERAAPGEPGELVCTRPFPTMPVKFWGKDGDKQYFDSYFSKYKHVWTQGDFCMIHPKAGNLIMLGRADGVLNPSGVRFGSSELYSVLDTYFPTQIADSIAIGQRRDKDPDESVIMWLQLYPGVKFTRQLVEDVKATIARELSKRHVPKYVFECKDIPQTINGKKVEVPVKLVVCGKPVKVSETVRNPESVDFYRQFVDVEKRWEEQLKAWGEGRAKL